MITPIFGRAEKWEVAELFDQFHYIGSACADPVAIFVYRLPGGLFGDRGAPIAAAIFAAPAARAWGNALELVRLVRAPSAVEIILTAFLARCVRELKADKRRFALLVSYADPGAGHHGGIYQAASWIYVGLSTRKHRHRNVHTGRTMSQRAFDQSTLKSSADWVREPTGRKHAYVFPLTKKGWLEWARKSRPYPKPKLAAVAA